jgi:hypothetical protein
MSSVIPIRGIVCVANDSARKGNSGPDDHIRRRRNERRYDDHDLIVRHAETSWDNDQVLTFNKTVETKFVKHRNNGWRVASRRKEETDTIRYGRHPARAPGAVK